MVGMKERIAPIKAISRGYQRRRMFSESLQMYVALRRRRMILLLSLTGLLLFSRNQNTATDTVHLRSCRRQDRDRMWNTYTDERSKKTFRIYQLIWFGTCEERRMNQLPLQCRIMRQTLSNLTKLPHRIKTAVPN